MARRSIFFVFLFAIAIAAGYYFRSARIADCNERGGTWISTSSKSGHCDELNSAGVAPGQ